MATPHLLSILQDGIVVFAYGSAIPKSRIVVELLRQRGLPIELQELEIEHFPYPEAYVELEGNVRGKTGFLLPGITGNPNDDFMAQMIACDAIRRGRARSLTILGEFLSYTRQDRVQAREPFTAKLIAEMIETNPIIEQMVTVDLHASQIAGFFNRVHVEDIPGSTLFVPHMRQTYGDSLDEITVVSTDVGGILRARQYAELLGAQLAVIEKRRERGEGSDSLQLIGKVSKRVMLVDDIGDTAGSLVGAARLLHNHEVEEITAYISHALLSPKDGTTAEAKLKKAGVQLVTSDSVPRDVQYLSRHKHITQIPSHHLIADLVEALISVNGSVKRVIKSWNTLKALPV